MTKRTLKMKLQDIFDKSVECQDDLQISSTYGLNFEYQTNTIDNLLLIEIWSSTDDNWSYDVIEESTTIKDKTEIDYVVDYIVERIQRMLVVDVYNVRQELASELEGVQLYDLAQDDNLYDDLYNQMKKLSKLYVNLSKSD